MLGEEEVLELNALDYLGEPFLDGHSVQCKLLLKPKDDNDNESLPGLLVASLPEAIYAKLKERSI